MVRNSLSLFSFSGRRMRRSISTAGKMYPKIRWRLSDESNESIDIFNLSHCKNH